MALVRKLYGLVGELVRILVGHDQGFGTLISVAEVIRETFLTPICSRPNNWALHTLQLIIGCLCTARTGAVLLPPHTPLPPQKKTNCMALISGR